MSKILFLGDLHFGIKPDSKPYNQHLIHFFEEFLFPLILKEGIKEVIQFGDVVEDRRRLNIKTFRQINKMFFSFFDKNEINLHMILGNHDIYYSDTDEINVVEELLHEYNSEYLRYYKIPFTKNIYGTDFDFITWINKNNQKNILDFIKKSKSEYCIGHFEINGFNVMNGIACKHGIKQSTLKKYKKVYSGHFHIQQKKANIHYIGTPYDMRWSDAYEVKGVHIWEDGKSKFIPYTSSLHNYLVYKNKPIDMSPYKDKYVKINVQDKTDKKLYEDFLNTVYASGCADVQFIETFKEEDIDIDEIEVEDTLKITQKYIDNVDNFNDKENILKLLPEIYKTAELKLQELS